MPYSDQQISQLANQLGSKGATPQEIETFVSNAKNDQIQSVAPGTMPKQAMAPSSAQEPILSASSPADASLMNRVINSQPMIPGMNFMPQVPDDNTPSLLTSNVARMGSEMAGTTMGAQMGAEVGSLAGPIGTAIGGVLGAAGGYGAVRYGEYKGNMAPKPTTGELAQAAILGGYSPGVSTASNALIRGGAQLLKGGAQYAISDAAKQAIDTGNVNTVSALTSSAIPALLSGFLGMASQGTTPPISDAMRAKVASAKQGADELGTVVAPSAAGNTSGLVGIAERFAQPVELERQASAQNVGAAMDKLRDILDLPDGAPITKQAIGDFQTNVYNRAYAPVANNGVALTDPQYFQDLDAIASKYGSLSKSLPNVPDNGVQSLVDGLKYEQLPNAQSPGIPIKSIDIGDALKMSAQLRSGATKAFNGDNAELGQASRLAATAFENQIERDLISRGADGQAMLSAFREGRVQMAQANLIENSLHWGPDDVGGTLQPGKIGGVFQKQDGQGLSDGLDALGAFASNQASYMQDASKMKPAGRGWMDNLIATGAGIGGLMHGGLESGALAAGAAGVAIPYARSGVRNFLLSPTGQAMLAKPSQASGFLPPTLAAQGIRAALLMKAAQDNLPTSQSVSKYSSMGQTAPAQ